MKSFTINGKLYNAKEFDFNLICDLEDYGVSMEKMQDKPMSMVRAYFSLCTNKGKEYAGKELEQHLINGGSFEDVVNVMSEEMEKSDFFRAVSKTEETEITEGKTQKTKKAATNQ